MQLWYYGASNEVIRYERWPVWNPKYGETQDAVGRRRGLYVSRCFQERRAEEARDILLPISLIWERLLPNMGAQRKFTVIDLPSGKLLKLRTSLGPTFFLLRALKGSTCGPQYKYLAFAASALLVDCAGHAADSNIGTVQRCRVKSADRKIPGAVCD